MRRLASWLVARRRVTDLQVNPETVFVVRGEITHDDADVGLIGDHRMKVLDPGDSSGLERLLSDGPHGERQWDGHAG